MRTFHPSTSFYQAGRQIPSVPPTRRTLLERLGTAAVAVSIAGCSEGRQTPTDTPEGPPSARSETPIDESRTPTKDPTDTATPQGSGCGPGPLPATDWPLAQRGPTKGSYIADSSTFDDTPAELWSVKATVPSDVDKRDANFGQPVIAGDTIYAVSHVQFGPNEADTGGHELQARHRTRGELAWSYRLPKQPPSPAIWDDLVLIPSGGTVYALDRREGSERWSRSFDANTCVVPFDDRLFVGGEKLSALAPDGSTLWERSIGDGVTQPPTVGPDGVYAGLSGGTVVALDSDTGDEKWTVDTPRGEDRSGPPSPNIYSIVATECTVLVVTDGDIDAFDLSGGFRWHVEGLNFNVATDGSVLYGRDRKGEPYHTVLRARDAGTGELVWERREEVVSGAHGVLTDEALYVPTYDHLKAIDPATGRERWHSGSAIEQIAFGGRMLVGTGDDGSLVALQ